MPHSSCGNSYEGGEREREEGRRENNLQCQSNHGSPAKVSRATAILVVDCCKPSRTGRWASKLVRNKALTGSGDGMPQSWHDCPTMEPLACIAKNGGTAAYFAKNASTALEDVLLQLR